jgi:squalene-associated FAD-dependent desaturase
MRVLVMGGGLAGLSSAVHLLDEGFEVTLLESENLLGGRASSWKDEDGDSIDNALHVFFPHYLNILGFFEKVGAKDVIRWTDTLTYFKADGKRADFKAYDLPAPLHGLSIVNFKHIGFMDLLRFGPAAMRALSMSDAALARYEKMTLEDFLHRYGVSRGLIDNMLRAMCNGLTFLEPHEVSAKAMAYWIRNLTTASEAVRVGFARGGLGEIYVDKAVEYITARGGKVIAGTGVKAINLKDGAVQSITPTKGRNMRADIYVSALPFQVLRRVLPEGAFRYRYFENLWRFEDAPSLSAQVWFDRKVLSLGNIATGVGTVFNWFADLTQLVPEAFPYDGSMLELVITPCRHLLPLPDEMIIEKVIEDIRTILPDSRSAEVRKWKLVRERQGVYAQLPHMDEYRPTQRTPLPNLYLAGDFTKAGHSAGMEGAVVSGKKVTSTILQDKMGVVKDLVDRAEFGKGLIPLIKYGQPAMLGMLFACLLRRKLRRA